MSTNSVVAEVREGAYGSKVAAIEPGEQSLFPFQSVMERHEIYLQFGPHQTWNLLRYS